MMPLMVNADLHVLAASGTYSVGIRKQLALGFRPEYVSVNSCMSSDLHAVISLDDTHQGMFAAEEEVAYQVVYSPVCTVRLTFCRLRVTMRIKMRYQHF